jgi:DNA repair protein RecN (Recombination protein N)
MPKARFSIECNRQDVLTKDGVDKVRFLFSANPGIEINEIAKIASGGELSRLMLSVKSMISEKNLLPTIIFDEIDNGVSGEVAGKVGNILKGMANRMQVIVITHLPQIAAKGGKHYQVFKKEEKDFTRTFIKTLSQVERVDEIAKMLSDETVSAAALQTAKELLGN